ncbi:MAG: hypothetical protein JSU63_21225 [Phycisphaerales bacterium]|nr:MAG: hypothetical protein JSU63_21225 [Phycisphaerales bacterium]
MGCGAEAATAAELEQALRAGFAPQRMVFDSPAKTVEKLHRAITCGVHINADSLQELDRIATLVKDGLQPTSIGARVNPKVGAGEIEATSTAVPGSKFGVSLRDNSVELRDRFKRYPWLTGLHVHVGSQGCDVELLTEGWVPHPCAARVGHLTPCADSAALPR